MKTRAAEKIQTKLVTLIFGPTFSGKTTLGLQLACFKRADGKPFRVAIIDAEGGGVDDAIEALIDSGVDMRNVHVFYTQSLQEATMLLNKIKNREPFYLYDEDGNETDEMIFDADGVQFYPDAVLLDGTSVLKLTSEQGLLELSKKRNTIKADKDGLIGAERFVKIQGADLEFKDYKKLNYSGQNLVLDLMSIGINVVLTGRERDETVQVLDKNGNQVSKATGKKLCDSFKGIDYNVKTILRMFQDPDSGQICAEVIKDRTGVHRAGEIITDPSLLDWQVVIDRNASRKEFILQNDLDKAVDTEQKMYENEAMQLHNSIMNDSKRIAEPIADDASKVKILQDEIFAKKKSLAPEKRNSLKAALESAGLPTAFKNVVDVTTLEQVVKILDANA